MRKINFLVVLLLLIPGILADEIIYNNVKVKITNQSITLTGEQNVHNVNFTYTNGTLNDVEFDFNNDFIRGENEPPSYVNFDEIMNITQKLTECEVLKGKFDVAWTKCLIDLQGCRENNCTQVEEDLSECKTERTNFENQVNTKTTEMAKLEEEQEENKNSRIMYGVGGLAVGVGLYWFFKERERKVADKSVEELDRRRVG